MAYEFSLENVGTAIVAVTAAVIYLETKFSKAAAASKSDCNNISLDFTKKIGDLKVEIDNKIGTVQLDIATKLGVVQLDIATKLGTMQTERAIVFGEFKTDLTGIKRDVSSLNSSLIEHIAQSDKKHDLSIKEIKSLNESTAKHSAIIKGLQSVVPPRPRRVRNIEETPAISEER